MVNPKIWGASGWRFLICTAADYPDNPGIDIQHNYNRYFYHLRWTLPCEICRSNYEQHFKKWPIDQYLKSRAALFRWLMIMYNEVQSTLNKKTKGPQDLLYELFGPEEGEILMQKLIYEDPDANITVIKPFDPTIAQYGGSKMPSRIAVVNPPTASLANKKTTVLPALPTPAHKSFRSRISAIQDNDLQGESWNNILIIIFLCIVLYYLYNKL